MRALLVLSACLIPTALSADNCRVVRKVQQVVVQKEVAVVAPVVATIAVAVPVAIPIFSYSNQACPPPVPNQTHDQADLGKLADLIYQRLETKLLRPNGASMAGPPAVLTNSDAGASAATRVLTANCARCHAAPASNGGGRVMFEGGRLLPLSREARWDAFDMAHTGKMPPNGPPLSDEDTAILQAWAREKR